jgi:hypothetical protein
MKSERVPVRQTSNSKKRYGKHRIGAVPLTIWEDKEFKDMLKMEAAAVDLPKWTLSDHVSFILRDHYGLWDKPYRPKKKK